MKNPCICCLKKAKLKSLSLPEEINERKISIREAFVEVTGLEPNDSLGICNECLSELINAYKFRLKVIENYSKVNFIKEEIVIEPLVELVSDKYE